MENDKYTPAIVYVIATSEVGIITIEALHCGAELVLVPKWTTAPDGQTQWPARGIRVAPWGYQPAVVAGHHFQLVHSIATGVLAGREVPQSADGALQAVADENLAEWVVLVRRLN